MRDDVAKIGEGVFFSEPPEDLDDWKVQFRGDASNYKRLLDAKQKWDPDNFFWCNNCVGSDDVTSTPSDDSRGPENTSSASSPLPQVAVFNVVKVLLPLHVLSILLSLAD